MSRRAIISVFTFASFILLALVVLFMAQGCHLDRQATQWCDATGIIDVDSEPAGAKVTIDGQARGATRTTLSNLSAGNYDVKVSKDGYSSWEKTVSLEKGKVVNIVALLVPVNPSLAPITSTPASNPLLSPDGQRLAYEVPNGTTPGIWMLDLSAQPFNFGRKPTLLVQDTDAVKYSAGQLTWDPSSKVLLISLENAGLNANFQVNTDNPSDLTTVNEPIDQVKQGWQDELTKTNQSLGADLPKNIQQILKDHSPDIRWSPDNLKFLYQTVENSQNVTYVYNKEQRALTKALSVDASTFTVVRWYADGQHLLVLSKDKEDSTSGTVSLMGMDGTNRQQVFNGTLIGDALYSYLSGSKLVILTSFNLQSSDYFLYSINLR